MIFHEGIILHENRLLANDSHEISYLIIFFRKLGKMYPNLSSTAVVIGALRVKFLVINIICFNFVKISKNSSLTMKKYTSY